MKRHQVLGTLHEVYRPRNYLEIGVAQGRSLSLSRVPSIAVDPDFRIRQELRCDLELVRSTSQDFFSRADALDHFREKRIDLAFVDGSHLFEDALFDFENVERLSMPTSVVVFDDVLPRSAEEAARDRHTKAWAGDVFKVPQILERHRPDLVCIPLDTEPTGLLLVLALDSSSRLLAERHDDLVAEFTRQDPQDVPRDVLRRRNVADPEAILGAGFWGDLVTMRDSGGEVPVTPGQVRELLENDPAARRWTQLVS